MRRVDRDLAASALGGLLAVSCALVAWSAAVVPFLACELFQGAARGCFWTGSQTHVVRGNGSSVGRLAVVNLVASIGQLIGPALASDVVHPEERGDAIAATGTFRAAALFASPLAVAGMLSGIILTPAMLLAGLLITLPALTTRRLRHAPEPIGSTVEGGAS